MKRYTGIAAAALTLMLASGCAAHGYGYRRFGPPPPPPPPRGMMMGQPYGGMVWVPGYERWEGRRWHRMEGRWMRPPRPGMVWVPGYRERRGGGWVWMEGHWR